MCHFKEIEKMTSIMQKINEDVMSVIEYMANNTAQIKLEVEGRIFTLSLTVEDMEVQE